MAKKRVVPAGLALLLLASCAPYTARLQLDTLNQTVPSGSLFCQRLAVEYRDLANYDYEELDSYENAAHFSRKGLEASMGTVVLPEDPDQWHISDGDAGQMVQDRQKMLTLLDNGGRAQAPNPAAVAQARFDCWVERAEKGDEGDTSVCRSQFYAALDQVQAALNKPAPAEVEAAPQVDELHQAMFLVFFDWNKSSITPTAGKVLDTVVSEAARLHASRIIVTGNADLSGTDRYNEKLALIRARAVKAELVSRGVSEDMIDVRSDGDTTPLVPTGRGVREPANRRAEIRFE
jgi:OOP family OmpA-OmpF porin